MVSIQARSLLSSNITMSIKILKTLEYLRSTGLKRSLKRRSKGRFKGYLDAKPKADNFKAEDVRVECLEVENASPWDVDKKLGNPVGECKVEQPSDEEPEVEDNSGSHNDANNRSHVEEFNVEEPKVEYPEVARNQIEYVSDIGHRMDVKDCRMDLEDSALHDSEQTLASSIESLEIETWCRPEAPRAVFLSLPTETLQAIFMELPTLHAAKALMETCRAMRAAFEGHEKRILLALLSRELGSPLPGTIGALAIFVSPQKGPFEEPILINLSISMRYWAKMLQGYEKEVEKTVTLTMADQMLEVYRSSLRKIGPQNRKSDHQCSTCLSLKLPEEEWNPLSDRTNGNCIEHLLQANAVRYRLNCRMALGHTAPGQLVGYNGVANWDCDLRPIVRDIMRNVESTSKDEPELDDETRRDNDVGSRDGFDLENDSGYEGEPGAEDAIDFYAGTASEEEFRLDISSSYQWEFEDESVFTGIDEIYQGPEVFAEDAVIQGVKLAMKRDPNGVTLARRMTLAKGSKTIRVVKRSRKTSAQRRAKSPRRSCTRKSKCISTTELNRMIRLG